VNFTTLFNLYKWSKQDKKNDTISEMAKNADKIEEVLGPISKRAIYVNEAPFNAKGDGTDETTKLQQAVSALPATGGILVFPAGYTFKHRAELNFVGKSRVTVFGYGSILESFPTTPVTKGFGNLNFEGMNNIAVFGLEIKANARSRLIPSSPVDGCGTINIMKSSNVWIRDVTIREAVSDGILSGGMPSDPISDNVLIENIHIDWARRNGVSFNKNSNSRLIGGLIENVGYDRVGAIDPLASAPMAGIDSENTSATGINRGIMVRGVTFKNNYIDVLFYGGHAESHIDDNLCISDTGATIFNHSIIMRGHRVASPTYIPKRVPVTNNKIHKKTISGGILLDHTDDCLIGGNFVESQSGMSIIDGSTNNRTVIRDNQCVIGGITCESVDGQLIRNVLTEYSSIAGFGMFLATTVKQASDNTIVSIAGGATGYQCADPTKTMFINNMFMGPGTSVYNYVNRTKEDVVMGTSTFIKRLIS
jgi:hypothetical protein